jgi:pantothenate kinase
MSDHASLDDRLDPPIAELVRRAFDLRRPAGHPEGPRILGITGAPGAGKSTLALALVDALDGAATYLPMDGFHLAQVELRRLGRANRKGAPDTFDAAGFVALLGRLRAATDEIVYAPAFDRALEEPIAGAIPIAREVPLVVTEGNYLLLDSPPWHGVRSLLDDAWYVELDAGVRVGRLIDRHVHFGRSPDAAREWVLRSDEANARLIQTSRGRADLVIRANAATAAS